MACLAGLLLALLTVSQASRGDALAPGENVADKETGPVGPCAAGQLCAFDDPEDLSDLPGSPWIMVSEEAKQPWSGIVALNTTNNVIIRYRQADLGPACLPGGRSGGLGVRREGKAYRLVHILHAADGGADRVEVLRVTMERGVPQLVRQACIEAPQPYFLNDIAPEKGGGFVATHMFDRSRPRAELESDFRAGRPTGFVVRWSAAAGWVRVTGTDGTFPNGIDVSPDGRWIAFAEIYGHALNRIRREGRDRRRVPLAMQPDNVTAAGGARFIVAGGIGKPMVSTRNCPALRRPGCGFPARAVSVDFARAGRQRILVTSGGASTPGISVALQKDGVLYLGTAFGDRITRIAPLHGDYRLP